MNKEQIEAYDELGQLIMDKTGCDSEQAAQHIEDLLSDTLAVLNEGALK